MPDFSSVKYVEYETQNMKYENANALDHEMPDLSSVENKIWKE